MVLPASMIDALAFRGQELEEGSIRTSYGELAAKLAKLKVVYLGEVGSRNVDVAFVTDELLGERGLLEMNVLRGLRRSTSIQGNGGFEDDCND